MRKWKEDLRRAHDAVRPLADGPGITHRGTIVCEVRKGKAPRTHTFIGTTSRAALDDGILIPGGMDGKRYDANPVVLWAHDQTTPPIGRTTERRHTDSGWEFDVQFADTDDAREIEHLVDTGFLRATSVGFRVTEYDRSADSTVKKELGLSPNGWIGRKWELLELSIVPVGADPGALEKSGQRRRSLFDVAARAGFKCEGDVCVSIPSVFMPTDNTASVSGSSVTVDGVTYRINDGWRSAPKEEDDMPCPKCAEAGRADAPPAEEPEDAPAEVTLADIKAGLDTIAEAVSMLVKQKAADEMPMDDDDEEEDDETPPAPPSDDEDEDEEDDEEEPEAPRGAGLYDNLFDEVKRGNELAQKVAK